VPALALALALTGACSGSGVSGESAPTGAAGKVIYVDPGLTSDTTTAYDPARRASTGGTATAYRMLRQAASVATAGTTVLLRAGTYGEPLAPANSGTADQPIVFKAYTGETVTLTGARLEPAVDLTGRSHVVIEGLVVDGVRRWLYAVRAHHNVIRNNRFLRALDPGASSKTGLFFEAATYNRVMDNTVEDGTADNLTLIKSERNVVEGNTFRKAGHALWAIRCGGFNVIRNNDFHNELQKIGEVYDCDRAGFEHDINLVDATARNLIEGNTFSYTPSSGNHSPYAGIQYAGQNGLLRRNLFYATVGPALEMALYEEEARFNTGNHVFHNVFYATRFAGISLPPAGPFAFSGNVFKNNVLARSTFQRNDTRWEWYRTLEGKPVQILTARLDGYLFEGNDILGTRPGEPYVISLGRRDADSNPPPQPLSWWQSQHPKLFVRNREADPRFVDPAAHDFHLMDDSPLIDAGVPLTRAVGSGNGTSLKVNDTGYFFDGYGIPGEKGDRMRLLGTAQTAQLLAVDHVNHILTLDQALTWSDGQGVALEYTGDGPDVGAYEKPR
jgi:hypothetical protein